jgi:general secretion pathway protein N
MKRLFLLGIVSTLVFLCVFAPAQLLGSLIGGVSNGRLGLTSSQGSFWHGSANIYLNSMDTDSHIVNTTQLNNTSVNLGPISWDIQPLQLLAGRLSVNVNWNNSGPFWVTLDTTRLHIEHAAFHVPAGIISALVPTLNAAQLGGQLSIRCENFSFTRTELLGQLDIDWNQSSSPLSIVNPLGSYHARIDGLGNAVGIKLETQGDSPLIMQGSGRWAASEGLHFDGTSEANPANKIQLQELLRVMGNETSTGSGRYQLKF